MAKKGAVPEPLQKLKAFSTAEAEAYGLGRHMLSRMVGRGDLVRIRQGYYAVTVPLEDGSRIETDDRMAKLSALATPGGSTYADRVICLETAACLHHLTNRQLGQVCVAIPWAARIMRGNAASAAQVFRWSDERMFRVGVNDMELSGRTIRVTSPERTVVDLLRYADDPRIGADLAREVLQKACGTGMSEADIMSIAGELGMEDVIRPWVYGAWRQDF